MGVLYYRIDMTDRTHTTVRIDLAQNSKLEELCEGYSSEVANASKKDVLGMAIDRLYDAEQGGEAANDDN